MTNEPIIKLRQPQEEVFRNSVRFLAMIWRRQFGKSFTLGAIGLDWMMASICDTFFVSAAIRLGVENIRKEAEIWAICYEALVSLAGERAECNALDDKGKLIDQDAICDLFEHSKLETKFWHSQTKCSRSMVVAPNPATAVGWTGNVIMDEVGRIPFFKDVFEAVEPIISSNPEFRLRMATTPPPDDNHDSYELLTPDVDEEFPANGKGNYYKSASGLLVHRVDAWDGCQAGVPLYDLKSGEEMTPEEHRAAALDKTAWDRNYGCKFVRGGSAALSLLHIQNAMALGEGKTTGINITDQLNVA